MRKGLLTELIGVFEDAKEMLGCGDPGSIDTEEKRLNDLRDEVLDLLREGDRLRRRADRTTPVPPSGRIPEGPGTVGRERPNSDGAPQSPPDTTRTPERPGARRRVKDAL